jgi:hypothetical protein
MRLQRRLNRFAPIGHRLALVDLALADAQLPGTNQYEAVRFDDAG